MSRITTLDQLAALYGTVQEASIAKVAATVTPSYRALIEVSPFAVLATVGPEGVDCSPRGDRAGFVRVHDANTVLLPDRRGNNRCDSLRNVVRDPRMALLFLIPGAGTTLRLNGRAVLETGADLLASFAVDGKPPRSVMVITVRELYFQCARAIVRSQLWDIARHVGPATLPTPGQVLSEMTGDRIDGPAYDAQWPARAAASLW